MTDGRNLSLAMSEPTNTYPSTEVVRALGIPRTSFDQWAFRGHLGLAHGPGRGKTRRLTFGEVVWVAALHELVKQGTPPANAAALLDNVRTEFDAAIRQDDGYDSFLMIEDTKAQVGDSKLLQRWLGGWRQDDPSYPRVDPKAPLEPPPPEGFIDMSTLTVRSPFKWLGEIPKPPTGITPRTSLPPPPGGRSVYVSMLHIGNLVWRVRRALDALDADG